MCPALVSFPTLESAPGRTQQISLIQTSSSEVSQVRVWPDGPLPRRRWKPLLLGLSLRTRRGARGGARDPPLPRALAGRGWVGRDLHLISWEGEAVVATARSCLPSFWGRRRRRRKKRWRRTETESKSRGPRH